MVDKPERVYLLVYSNTALGTREQVKTCLEQLPQVLRWRTDLPNSFYLISQADKANEIVDALAACMGKRGRFILAELGPNVQGWLVPETWSFLKRQAKEDLNE